MRNTVKKGFTLIELSLSIAFIGILSLAVALIITNIISAYKRGLTLSQVNTVGSAIVEDIRMAIKESPVRSAVGICDDYYNGINDSNQTSDCEKKEAMNLISLAVGGNVKIGERIVNAPVYGMLCTGKYSYVFASGYLFSDDYEVRVEGEMIGGVVFKYKYGSGETETEKRIEDFKLLKIKDEKRAVCQSQNKKDLYEIKEKEMDGARMVINIETLSEDPVDILKNTSFEKGEDKNIVDNNLAVYDLSSAVPVINEKAHTAFYRISFILGTVQGGINIASKGNFCTTPEDYDNDSVENFDYCSINKFNFAAQANGG